MAIMHQGSARWMITRQRDGSIVWSVAGTRLSSGGDWEPERVLARGASKSGAEAQRAAVAAIGEFVLGIGRPR